MCFAVTEKNTCIDVTEVDETPDQTALPCPATPPVNPKRCPQARGVHPKHPMRCTQGRGRSLEKKPEIERQEMPAYVPQVGYAVQETKTVLLEENACKQAAPLGMADKSLEKEQIAPRILPSCSLTPAPQNTFQRRVPPSMPCPPPPQPAVQNKDEYVLVKAVRPSGGRRISRWQSVERVPDCCPKGSTYPNSILTQMAKKKLYKWMKSGGLDSLLADVSEKRFALDASNETWASMPQAVC